MEPQNILSMKAAKKFVLGGRATITISNGQGEHFTFRIRKWSPMDRETGKLNESIVRWFVGVLVSADNENDYKNVAELNPRTFELTQPGGKKRGYISKGDKRFKVAVWMFGHIVREQDFVGPSQGYSVRHSGRCGRCARKLTTPESIDTGFGPECSAVLGVEWRERPVEASTPLLDQPEV